MADWQVTRDATHQWSQPGQGVSLRAEIRRLHRQQNVLVSKVDALFSTLCGDREILDRLVDLGRSLRLHQELDSLNGHHRHNLGDALSAASCNLSGTEVAQCRLVKRAGDKARHNASVGRESLSENNRMVQAKHDGDFVINEITASNCAVDPLQDIILFLGSA